MRLIQGVCSFLSSSFYACLLFLHTTLRGQQKNVHRILIAKQFRSTTERFVVKSKPGWATWIAWLLAYTILDMLADVLLLHGSTTWSHVFGSILPASFTATITWLFTYRKWLKSDSLY